MTAQPLENKNSVERTAGDGKLSPQEVHYMKEIFATQTALEAVQSWCNVTNIKLQNDLSQWEQKNASLIQPYLSVLGLNEQSSALDKALAVIKFQKDHGLTPDGIIGPKTLQALAKALQQKNPANVAIPRQVPLPSTLESHELVGQRLNLASVTISGDSIANGLRIASGNKKVDNAFSGREIGFIANNLKPGSGDLLFQGGTNNIFHRKSAQDTFAEMIKFVAVAKGKGYANVILSTIPSGPKLNQNAVQQLNNMIRQSGLPYIDIAAQKLSYSDGIHLKNYGVANNLLIQKNGKLPAPLAPVVVQDTMPKAKTVQKEIVHQTYEKYDKKYIENMKNNENPPNHNYLEDHQYLSYLDQLDRENGFEPGTLAIFMGIESLGRLYKGGKVLTSPAKCKGLFQFNPKDTSGPYAEKLQLISGFENTTAKKIEENPIYAAKAASIYIGKFIGSNPVYSGCDIKDAIVAYNAGEGGRKAIKRKGKMRAETNRYIYKYENIYAGIHNKPYKDDRGGNVSFIVPRLRKFYSTS